MSSPSDFSGDDRISSLADALTERYRIEREIGAGGMATVYLAEDVRHHRKVAIKVLHPELSAVLGPERFLKEIELMRTWRPASCGKPSREHIRQIVGVSGWLGN